MTTPAGLSWKDAIAAVHSPGQMFELVDAEVRGVNMKVFKHAPANLAQIFGLARGHGDKDFLVYEGERWSFAQTFQHVDALANRLANVYGIKKGDRVAVAMRNYPEWAMSFAGILISGGVSVSMNSWWTEDEMDYALRDCGAKVLICDDQRFENARKTCAELGIHVLLVRS